MPCFDGQASLYETIDANIVKELKNKVNLLTRVLCFLCRNLYGYEIFTHLLGKNSELREWWTAHQKEDELRAKAINHAMKQHNKLIKKKVKLK